MMLYSCAVARQVVAIPSCGLPGIGTLPKSITNSAGLLLSSVLTMFAAVVSSLSLNQSPSSLYMLHIVSDAFS